MEYGRISGIETPISRLVQGTTMLSSARAGEHFALLDGVLELGCTAFDTGHGYGQGDVERLLGRWIHDRGVRDRIVIIDKGAHHNQDRRRVTPFDITADLHDSLARLRIETIDLYLLHRDDPSVPVGPIVEVLNQHQRAGLIRAFGGSNWSHQRIAEANAYAVERGLQPFVASSPNLSLAFPIKPPWPDCISISGPTAQDARDWYARQHMPVFSWSSLAGGFFTGRYRRDNLDTLTTSTDRMIIESYATEDNFRRLDRARELGERHNLSIAQIALAYVLSQPLDIYALVGCQIADEFRANAEAAALRLSPDELAWLDLRG